MELCGGGNTTKLSILVSVLVTHSVSQSSFIIDKFPKLLICKREVIIPILDLSYIVKNNIM